MAEIRSATLRVGEGRELRLRVVLGRAARSPPAARPAPSAISRAFAVTHTPEALMQERPPFSTIEDTITSRWRCQSALASGPSTTLL